MVLRSLGSRISVFNVLMHSIVPMTFQGFVAAFFFSEVSTKALDIMITCVNMP